VLQMKKVKRRNMRGWARNGRMGLVIVFFGMIVLTPLFIHVDGTVCLPTHLTFSYWIRTNLLIVM
jgi:hypothetical protein